MLKIYCSQCGSPTEYSLNKPKFCSSCGVNFYSNIKTVNKVSQKPIVNIKHDDFAEADEEVEISEVPQINNLDFDIDVEKKPVQKISDILGSAKSNPYRELEDVPLEHNTENIVEQFKKEAGAIRPKHKNRKFKNGQ